MKKKALLLPILAGLAYVLFSSYASGPAYYGINRTGSQSTVTNCSGSVSGTGCHGAGTGTSVLLTVDSGATTTATTHYIPGYTYTIKIHGTNTASLPDFGWELSTVSGTGSGQVQAGAFSTTIPTHTYVDSCAGTGLHIFEQGAPWLGAPAGTYDVAVQWTAPATNVGNITLYCTLNAVVGTSGSVSASDASGNTSLVLTPITSASVVSAVSETGLSAYPNPVTGNFNMQLDNAQSGTYTIQIFNMIGSVITTQNIEVNNAIESATINTSNWASGLYNVVIEKDGNKKSVLVVKQ